MAEGEQATATATAQGSEGAPASAATPQTPQGAGGSAGQASQQAPQAAPESISVSKSEYDSIRANAGRFEAIQKRGDLDVMSELQDQGLSRQAAQEIKKFLKDDMGGMTMTEFFKAVQTPPAPTGQPAGTTPGQQQPPRAADPNDPNRPLTMADFQRMQNEKTEQEKQNAATAEVKQFWDKLHSDFKVTGGAKAKSLKGIISAAEQAAIAEDIQKSSPYINEAEALRMAGDYIPTTAQLARARQMVENDWKDLGNEIISAAAKGQEGLPAGTIGGGAGGPVPPPGKAGQMTESQKHQAVLAKIREVTAAGGYVAPAN